MDLKNKLQKNFTKGITIVSLMALASLSGCRSYLHFCPAYTNNSEEKGITKMDSIDIVMDYDKQNYQLNN